MRVALPSVFSGDPVHIPGTSASHRPALNFGGDLEDLHRPGKPKGKNKKQPLSGGGATGPGSKASLAYPINANELWFSGVVFKTDEIAKHYKITNPTKLCWPVILSKKKGDDALEVCPSYKTHGALTAAPHVRPKSFDLDYIYKNFTRAPTKPENDKANWKAGKKRKI